jgi:hypothetical protein
VSIGEVGMGEGIAGYDAASFGDEGIVSPDLSDRIKATVFRLSSYLTDPVCKAHEFFRRISLVDVLNPSASKIANFWRRFCLTSGMIGCILLSVVSAPVGFALRATAAKLQKTPFIFYQTPIAPKQLGHDRTFSLLSWNICCIGGGYAISDGGVMPWTDRIDKIADKILEKNADVNCIYETFDLESAFQLRDSLQEEGYTHFYYNISDRWKDVTSGIAVASKYKITNPEFAPFSLDSLVGRTKSAAKGVFAFDLESRGKSFARIFATHLQHSELPEFPTIEEVDARKAQMQAIVEKVEKVRDKCLVVTGDLNLDDLEYQASVWSHRFDKGTLNYGSEKTWGGDGVCAMLVNKPISNPLNLDHTMIVKETAQSIDTQLVHVGFDGKVFNPDALSDHAGLFSKIKLHP